MQTKYYAVRKGRAPGIYTDWNECKSHVLGYPGAEYKGFNTEPEAKEYLNQNRTKEPNKRQHATIESATTAEIYVDGSYNKEMPNFFSYGCVILHNGKKKTISEAHENAEMASMRNVAGEIIGALAAMKWCIENNVPNLHLYYDYAGIEKWCTCEWQTKNKHTKKYKQIYDKYTVERGLSVTFHKVKSHTGNQYNEEADCLAKAALSN